MKFKPLFWLFGLTLLVIIGSSLALAVGVESNPALSELAVIYPWELLAFQNATHSLNGTPYANTFLCGDLNYSVTVASVVNCSVFNASYVNYSDTGYVINSFGFNQVTYTKALSKYADTLFGWVLEFDALFGKDVIMYINYKGTSATSSPSTNSTSIQWNSGGSFTTRTIDQLNSSLGSAVLPYTETSNYTSLSDGLWHKIHIEYLNDVMFTVYVDDKIAYYVDPVNISKVGYLTNPEISLMGGGFGHYNTTIGNISFYTTAGFPLITSCSGTPSNLTLNFSIFNESNPDTLLVSSLKASFEYLNYGLVYNFSLSGSDSYAFCINNAADGKLIDAEFQYAVGGGFTNSWYLNKYNTSLVPEYIEAGNYGSVVGVSDLKATARQSSNFRELSGIYATLEREYIGGGGWKPVQMSKSGDFGLLFFNVVEESVNYRFKFRDENNTLLRQTDSLKLVCESGVCELTFLIDTTSSVSERLPVGVSYSYDDGTKLLTVTFNDVTDTVNSVRVRVTKETYSRTVEVCNDVISASSGSVVCDTTGYTGPFLLQVSSTASPELFDFTVPFADELSALAPLIGPVKVNSFYFSLVLITLASAGAAAGAVPAALFTIVGLFVAFVLNILSFIESALVLVVCVVMAVIVVKVRQNGQ